MLRWYRWVQVPLNKLEGLRCYITPDAAEVVAARVVYPREKRDNNQRGPTCRDTAEKLPRCGGGLRPDQAAGEGRDAGAAT